METSEKDAAVMFSGRADDRDYDLEHLPPLLEDEVREVLLHEQSHTERKTLRKWWGPVAETCCLYKALVSCRWSDDTILHKKTTGV